MRHLYNPKKDCGVGTQDKVFCFQSGEMYFLMFFVLCRVVGCQVLVLIDGCICRWHLLLVVRCRLSIPDCRLMVGAVGGLRWFLAVGSRLLVLVVDCLCRLLLFSFSIVGAQLCCQDLSPDTIPQL
jgi:hypothetical protein